MQCVGTLKGPMTVKDIVCNSITMHAHDGPWPAKLSLENDQFSRGSVVLRLARTYTHKKKYIYIYIYIYIY